ncbi:MAG: hypothetical protein EBT18_08275 [Gammaproteobacteria bacterium]|nr:hypothetical protein [Gammaproteobacteria bacterium]
MTQRSELKQRYLETKASMFGWLASKLFTYRETGVDGFVKRILLPKKNKAAARETSNRKL